MYSDRMYEWELTPPYVPSHIKTLPQGEGFSFLKIIKFNLIVIKGVLGFIFGEFLYGLRRFREGKIRFQKTADFGLADTFETLNEWHKLEDFDYFYKPWMSFIKPKVAANWAEDAEFGRQRLYGINPAFIRQCHPEDLRPGGKFPVSESLVTGLISGSDLASKLEQRQLYWLDYGILSQILTPELEDQLGKYSTAPLCLLQVDEQSRLLPLAIRLFQGESSNDLEHNPILTPNSPSQSWLSAKLAVASSDIAYQGIISHLLNTHLVVETFAVSTFRQLPSTHVLFQLLRPHFFNTFAINEMARGIFLGHDGFFDETGALGFTGSNELLQRAYAGNGGGYQGEPYLFYQKALPFDLAAREVYSLPNYYYRDDALLIWDAIHSYVSNILKLVYPASQDLVNDRELQAWKQELVSPDYGRLKGLLAPDKSDQITGLLTEVSDLADILSNIIFTASAQHSAVNFGQYEYAGFVPNMPFAAYKPFSDVSNDPSLPTVDFVERLPNRVQTIKQMILVKALSLPVPDSSPSLLTMLNPFKNSDARQVFKAFQDRLLEIEQKITVRNESVEYPYIRLMPSNIAQSIAI